MHYALNSYGGVEVWLHAFITLALDGKEWLASRRCRLTPGETAAHILWIGGWVDFEASMEAMVKRKNTCPFRESKPSHPADNLVSYTNL
jgi:hypothetical protein